MNQAPSLIGICGGSCSGKTTITRLILQRLGDQATHVSFDDYFLKPDPSGVTDWESPDLYNYSKFIQDLVLLRSGQPVILKSNSRESDHEGVSDKVVEPKSTIFVEGFLIYHHPDAAELFDSKYFIDLPEQEMIARRMKRTLGDGPWNTEEYIKNGLVEGYRSRVLPQRLLSDVTPVDGLSKPEVIASLIMSDLRIRRVEHA